MKIAVFFIFLFAIVGHAGPDQHLTVIIKNIRDSHGQVGAALYGSENDFLKKYLDTRSTNAAAGEIRLVFDHLVPGTYAISVLHDLNGNGDMDTDFLGIPKEGFGFSNDVMGAFGPPKFEKAKFYFDGKDQMIVITMHYI